MRNKFDANKGIPQHKVWPCKALWKIQTHPEAEAAVALYQRVITDHV